MSGFEPLRRTLAEAQEMIAEARAVTASNGDACEHGCGNLSSVQHADGRALCSPCYLVETGLVDEPYPGCPTCGPTA